MKGADWVLVSTISSADPSAERGSTLLEFAIVTPILLLLLFGIIEIGLATYRLQGLHAASRDAARIGSYPAMSQTDIEARALASLESTLLETPPTITIEPDVTFPCADSEEVVVTIVAQSPISIPFWGSTALDLTSRAEFACEG